jgi:hypothetical protein
VTKKLGRKHVDRGEKELDEIDHVAPPATDTNADAGQSVPRRTLTPGLTRS